MATHNVVITPVQSGDIGGMQTSRYDKLEVAFGTIPTGSFAVGDQLNFVSVRSKTILKAEFRQNGVSLGSFLNDTNFSTPVSLAGTGGTTFGYWIMYLRGGEAGTGSSTGATPFNIAATIAS
jgi:hypothetical protein